MSPKKKSEKNGGAKIHKSNIAKAPSEKGSAAQKIIIVFVVLALLVAGLLLFNKLGGCSMCKNLSDYKESYDELSGSDTQDITSEELYDDGGAEQSYTVTPSSVGNVTEEEPKVDNSSDASILDMFTGCGGRNEENTESGESERLIEVSPTDVGQFDMWEQPDGDAAYKAMMRSKLDEYITLFTRLDDLRSALADCKNEQQVESSEKYAAIKADLLNWCGGAQSFSAVGLGEECREAAALASQVAEDTRYYLSRYPTLVSTGAGEAEARELSDNIINNLQQINSIITA